MNSTNGTAATTSMPDIATDILHCIILVSTLIGNFLLILCLTFRKEGLKLSDKLMLNTVVCNILLVLIAIPMEMSTPIDDYPFTNMACKLVGPLSTYLLNSCVFTYVAIAIERWIVVSSLHHTPPTKVHTLLVFLAIHMCGLFSVTPYMPVLKVRSQNGKRECSETWEMSSRRSYTLVLFLLQYGVPVPLLIVFYTKIWLIVFNSNKKVVTSMLQTAITSITINVINGESFTSSSSQDPSGVGLVASKRNRRQICTQVHDGKCSDDTLLSSLSRPASACSFLLGDSHHLIPCLQSPDKNSTGCASGSITSGLNSSKQSVSRGFNPDESSSKESINRRFCQGISQDEKESNENISRSVTPDRKTLRRSIYRGVSLDGNNSTDKTNKRQTTDVHNSKENISRSLTPDAKYLRRSIYRGISLERNDSEESTCKLMTPEINDSIESVNRRMTPDLNGSKRSINRRKTPNENSLRRSIYRGISLEGNDSKEPVSRTMTPDVNSLRRSIHRGTSLDVHSSDNNISKESLCKRNSGGVVRRISSFFSLTGGVPIDGCPQMRACNRRKKQTQRMLTRFTIITMVFILCMLPNQILWLIIDFFEKGDEFFSPLTRTVIHFITYANCVINPFLYGNFDAQFRLKVYRVFHEARRTRNVFRICGVEGKEGEKETCLDT